MTRDDSVPRRVALWLGRATAIGLAAAAVGAVAFLLIGPPTEARAYRQDEIARFAPTAAHGLGQLGGEALLICLVACIGRRWLRIRL